MCSHFGRFVNQQVMGPEGALDVTKIKRRASSFTIRIRSLSNSDIINHTFEKQPWQPEYDMRITWEGSVEICYDIINYTSKPPWQSEE